MPSAVLDERSSAECVGANAVETLPADGWCGWMDFQNKTKTENFSLEDSFQILIERHCSRLHHSMLQLNCVKLFLSVALMLVVG